MYDKGIAIAFQELCRNRDSLPDKVNGRLAIAVTRLAWSEIGVLGLSRPYFKDEVVSEFLSNEDIVQCIVASALIPFALNGKPFVRFRDWICADGVSSHFSVCLHIYPFLYLFLDLHHYLLLPLVHEYTLYIVSRVCASVA